jgi:hypothetical protein
VTTDTMLDLRPTAKPALTAGNVLAVWLQNFGGGIGAATITALACWGFAVDAMTTLRWSLTVGGVIFGVLMILRSAIDEIVDGVDYRTMIADMEALEQQIADERAEHEEEQDKLLLRIRTLQNDLNLERRSTWDRHAGPHSRPAVQIADAPVASDPTSEDACKLLERAYAGQPWGKDNMRRYCDMNSTQWAAARDLLITRGIVARGKNQTVLLYQTHSDALSALHGTANIDQEVVAD